MTTHDPRRTLARYRPLMLAALAGTRTSRAPAEHPATVPLGWLEAYLRYHFDEAGGIGRLTWTELRAVAIAFVGSLDDDAFRATWERVAPDDYGLRPVWTTPTAERLDPEVLRVIAATMAADTPAYRMASTITLDQLLSLATPPRRTNPTDPHDPTTGANP